MPQRSPPSTGGTTAREKRACWPAETWPGASGHAPSSNATHSDGLVKERKPGLTWARALALSWPIAGALARIHNSDDYRVGAGQLLVVTEEEEPCRVTGTPEI